MSNRIFIIIPSIISLLSVRWIYFWILKVAKNRGVVDNPGTRKLHKEPIPVMGGIAVFFGTLVGVLFSAAIGTFSHTFTLSQIMPLICAMTILQFIGLLDDLTDLTPVSRMIWEILVVCFLIYSSGCAMDDFAGLWSIGKLSWRIAVPLTVFASVGIINAINMVDGVNGLASTLCIMSCLFFGVKFLRADCLADSVVAFCVASSILPFVIHNLFGKSSRMFLGDAGTMPFGLLVSYFVTRTIGDSCVAEYASLYGQSMISFSLAVLSLPVFDALRVMLMRIVNGCSPFAADKTHLHHLFIALGFGHLSTTLCEVVLNLLVITSWYISLCSGAGADVQFYVVAGTSLLLIWGTGFLLQTEWVANSRLVKWLQRRHEESSDFRTYFYTKLAELIDAPEQRKSARDSE